MAHDSAPPAALDDSGPVKFALVIPSEHGLTPDERETAPDSWPVRVHFKNEHEFARFIAKRGPVNDTSIEKYGAETGPTQKSSRGSRLGRQNHGPLEAPEGSLDAALEGVMRRVVRDELQAGAHAPRPHIAPPMVAASKKAPGGVGERLTVATVAEELGVEPATVRTYIRSGDLKASRVGPEGKGRIYSIARGDLDDYISRRRVDPEKHDIDDEADSLLRRLKPPESS